MCVDIGCSAGLREGKGKRLVLRRVIGWDFPTRSVALGSVVVAFALMGPSGAPPPAPQHASAATLPPGFVETTVLSGLTNPTVVRFVDDGRVFVAEKSGLLKVFDNLSDTTPTIFADLRTNVHNFWDRGPARDGAAPGLPGHAVRLRPLRPRRRDRGNGAPGGAATRAPPRRARPRTAASRRAGSRDSPRPRAATPT